MLRAVRKILLLAVCAAVPRLSSAAPPAASAPAASAPAASAPAASPPAASPPAAAAHALMMAAPATPLATLVEEAVKRNPEVQAAEHGWRAAAEVPRQARALPETQLSVQELSVGSPRPLAGFNDSEFAYVGVGASQDLPYPGKRALRAAVATHQAAALHEDAAAVRRRVVEALALTYYRLAYVQQTLGILERHDGLLQQIEQVVESRYRVGQGNQQDVLRAQLQHTKILREVAMHHQEEAQLQAQLKQALNRPQASPGVVAEPLLATVLQQSDADLLRQAAEQDPDLRARRESLRGKQAQVKLARRELRPDFNVQAMYERTGAQFRDYYTATFGIRLPNRGRRAAELAAAEEDEARAEQELQAEAQRVASEVTQQLALLRGSEERLKIYDEGLVPQAEATFQAGIAAYESNRQDFATLLASFLDVLELDLERHRELAEHESTLARLERLTGETLP